MTRYASSEGFSGNLQLDFGDWRRAGRIAVTLAPVDWHGASVAVTIPAGYMSDGASVPRLLWWFLPPWGDRATFAALLHDYLLDRLQGFENGGPIIGAATRKACDGEFLAALLALEVPRWRAWLAWSAVRAHSVRIVIAGSADRPLLA
jgi:hypothetical protein